MAYDKSKVKVMIVDDEDSIRQMLVMALREEGWTVAEATNGKEAYDQLAELRPHIIVSDINMPEMTGVELLEKVRAEHPKIEFIIMTSDATLDTAVKAVGLGAYDYLNKPFEDISAVPKKIEKVADKILLRQQNQELIKRLKNAGLALKRLLERIAPLNSVIEMEKLVDVTLQSFPALFQDESVRASWWSFSEETGEWLCKKSIPEEESFSKASSPDQVREAYPEYRHLHVTDLKYEEEIKDKIIYESLKPSLGDIFMQQVQLTYEKVHYHQDIASLASRDGLTRLFNHRYFQDRLRQELLQAQRQKSGVSLILIDIDHFKNYNDTNGHPAGDELLRSFADLLSDQKESQENPQAKGRVTDIIARYGGEEFVMILPFTFFEGAKTKAERIRKAVEDFTFAHGEKQPLGKLTISVGVASYPMHGDTPEALIQVADKALYLSKKAGRNRVTGADEVLEDNDAAITEPAPIESQGEPRIDQPTPEAVVSSESDEDMIASEDILLEEEVPEPPKSTEEVPAEVVEESEEPKASSAEVALESAESEEAPAETVEESAEPRESSAEAEVQAEVEKSEPEPESVQAEESPLNHETQETLAPLSHQTLETPAGELRSGYEDSAPDHSTQETPRLAEAEEEETLLKEELTEPESSISEEVPADSSEDFLSAFATEALQEELRDPNPVPEVHSQEEVQKDGDQKEIVAQDESEPVRQTLGAILQDDAILSSEQDISQTASSSAPKKKLGIQPLQEFDVDSLVDAISDAVDNHETQDDQSAKQRGGSS